MYRQQDFFQLKRSTDIRSELEAYSEMGTSTQTVELHGIPYFINQFWTARQRQAHRIHELSYRACFKPQLPAFFIDRLTQPGDVVYDPFMGRGTTPIEAALRNRIPYGNDINPLSRALTEPRINPPSIDQIVDRLSQIPWAKFKSIKHKELLVFYHKKTLSQIEGLRSWLDKRRKRGKLDQTRSLDQNACHQSFDRSFLRLFFCIYSPPPIRRFP